MKILKKISKQVHQNVILRIMIGIFSIILISSIWTWSIQACSPGRPNIRILYELDKDFTDNKLLYSERKELMHMPVSANS